MACSLDCKKGKRKHSDHGLFMPKIPDRNDNGLETENSFGTMACCYQFFHKYIANKSLVQTIDILFSKTTKFIAPGQICSKRFIGYFASGFIGTTQNLQIQ